MSALTLTLLSFFMTQLGKAFKGKAKDKAAKKGKAGGDEKVLQDKLKRMEEMDYRKRLAKQLRAELTVRPWRPRELVATPGARF